MKTVVILAYECTPFHRPGSTIGAQRPFQFAKWLPQFGWRTIVLCCEFRRRYTLHPERNWQAQIAVEVERAYDSWNQQEPLIIPLPSLKYADLVDRLWLDSVVMDPIDGTFSPKKDKRYRIQRKVTTLLKLLRGDHSQSWQAVCSFAVEALLKKDIKIEGLLAEHGPDAGLFSARLLKKQLPAVFDFRDPVDRGMKPFSKWIFRRFVRPSFSFVKGIVNVNEFWADLDSKRFGKPSLAISNGFDLEEFGISKHTMDPDSLTIGWFGNIQSGQTIEPLLNALRQIEVRFPIRFIFRGGNAGYYKKQLQVTTSQMELDVADRVPRPEALGLMKQCDILLLLSLKKPQVYYLSKGLVPGKTFEYIALQKPILVVPGDGGMLDQLILKNDFGKVGKGAVEIAELLETAFRQKKNQTPIWEIAYGEDAIQPFSRRQLSAKLATFLDQQLIEE